MTASGSSWRAARTSTRAASCSRPAWSTARRTIPGLEPLWGDSVFHCPFCHGWEVRDQPIAVLAEGEKADHLVGLLRSWSDDVVLLSPDRPIKRLVAEDGKLTAIEFEDGETLPRSALLVAVTFHQRSDLAEQLGVAVTDQGFLEVDGVPGHDRARASTRPATSRASRSPSRPRSPPASWLPRWSCETG